MNEDEHGITPASVTAMTVEGANPGWLVTVERGNGADVQQVLLTDMERAQLAGMLEHPGTHMSFVELSPLPD